MCSHAVCRLAKVAVCRLFASSLLCRFLAVGGYDNIVRILSLEDGTQLRAVATQAVNVRGSFISNMQHQGSTLAAY
jgi:hypothetical protein